MSRNPLRKDKTCLNCNYVVENRFCPNCGQENTDTRKTFYHLFVHFFEDLTHYENSFWKTIKSLFLKPAALTKAYLSGKRISYLAPIRLYIFISFVTFFIITFFPRDNEELAKQNQDSTLQISEKNEKETDSLISKKGIKKSESLKALEESQKENKLSNIEQNESFFNFGYKNLKELDSLQKFGPADEKLGKFRYYIIKKTLEVKTKYNKEELMYKFVEGMLDNFPKALFFYLPLFAFVLWLFHGKKRWYYFDHGIFTLHYFSFLLLSLLLNFFFRKFMNCFVENSLTNFIKYIGMGTVYIWMFYYFFPAHHRFYGESRTISLVKSIAILFINIVLMTAFLIVFIVYTFINLN